MRCVENDSDLRIDLPAELRQDLKTANRDFYSVVAYSHLDKDHICGSSGFFYLKHATKHQGTDRIKICELWVLAAANPSASGTELPHVQQGPIFRVREFCGTAGRCWRGSLALFRETRVLL